MGPVKGPFLFDTNPAIAHHKSMIQRYATTRLLGPAQFHASDPRLTVIGVFNPGAVRYGDEIILLVRVAEAAAEQREGLLSSPRAIRNGEALNYEIDWFEPKDARDFRKPLLPNGLRRLTSISHLEIIRLTADGLTVKSIEQRPELFPTMLWEEYGLEDPRITQIGSTYFITYVAVSATLGICTALLSTTDFLTFQRHGIIFPTDNKDATLFPEMIAGKFSLYHRPMSFAGMTKATIVLAHSPDLFHWGEYLDVMTTAQAGGWDSDRIGAGPPPLRTPDGWLSLYHGVQFQSDYDVIGRYSVGAFVADLDHPELIRARTSKPILQPETEFEQNGFVPNVIFPTGLVPAKDNPDSLLLFYGAADQSTAVMQVSQQEILASLLPAATLHQ